MKHFLSFNFFFGRSPKRFLQAIFVVSIFQFGSPISTFAQSTQDSTSVLQQCLDLPQLQQYYPKDGNGNPLQANIMHHVLEFPANLNLAHGGLGINYLPQTEISLIPFPGFFIFRNISIGINNSNVVFNFFYKINTAYFRIVNVNVELEKSGSNWTITNFNITGETL